MITFLLTCFLSTSCGGESKYLPNIALVSDEDPRENLTIDPAFLPLLKEFEGLYGKKVLNIPINFGEEDKFNEKAVGVCITYTYKYFKYKEIKVLKSYWDEADDYTKENLIFHELGHCVLNRNHDDEMMLFKFDTIEGKGPKSIMNTYLVSTYWQYSIFNKYYKKELFEGVKRE